MAAQDSGRSERNAAGERSPSVSARPHLGAYTASVGAASLRLSASALATLDPQLTGEGDLLHPRYRAAFDLVPLALALVDRRLQIVDANARFRAVFGMPDANAPARFVHEVFPVGESDLTAAIISAARGLPGVATTVLLRVGRDSRAVMASCLAVAGDPADSDVLVVLRELHEAADSTVATPATPAISALESSSFASPGDATPGSAESQGANAAAQTVPALSGRRSGADVGMVERARSRERRLAAVGQLAAGVMHDVNNALNPIVAAAYLLNLHADDPEMVRHYAARIAAAAETGAATAARVGRMLRQEPVEDAEPRPIELATLADEVLAMTRPLWQQRARGGSIRLVRELEPGIWIRGVAGEVREALLNLVHNSLDAMEQGGTLTARSYISNGMAVLEVEDDGAGMPPEVADHAFDPFFSTKGAGGSGLGLAEVVGIMRRHGGLPELRSAAGQGTLVRLSFPRSTAGEEAAATRRITRVARKVLVVEDNPDNREFIRALLVSDGHAVDVAPGVEDALALLDQRQQGTRPFDLVITDVGLLDGSGWELVSAARNRWPSLRIGIVTGWDATGDGEGDVDFILRKPIRTDSLLAAISG